MRTPEFKKFESVPGDKGKGGKESVEARNARLNEMRNVLAREIPIHRLQDYGEDWEAFGARLRAKYSNFNNYQVYHIISGSTLEPKYDITEDFPGEDSVEQFLKYLYEKYVIKENGPSTLDVISVDGRWGQVISTDSRDKTSSVVRLDGKEPRLEHIDFSKYELSELVKSTVSKIKKDFTKDELARVHWGDEQKANPALRLQVKVFGKYIKKSK